MEEYQAIIIGAGPSGIILAKELSKNFKILLIEKGKIGNNGKAYTTAYDLLVKEGLQKYITSEFSESIIEYGSIRRVLKHHGATIDEKKFFLDTKEIITKQGGIVRENEEVSEIKYKNREVFLKSNKGEYKTKLLLDCSAGQSVIARKQHLYKRRYHCTVLGGRYRIIKGKLGEILLGEIIKLNPLSFIEVFPYDGERILIYAFEYNIRKKEPELIREFLDKSIFYIQNKYGIVLKLDEELKGTSQFGTSKTNAIDNTIFYGDSGYSAAPFITSVFTNTLQYYNRYIEHIRKCIIKNSYQASDLQIQYSPQEELNKDILMIITSIFYNGTKDNVDKGFELLAEVKDKTLANIILMKLDVEDAVDIIKVIFFKFAIQDILALLPKEDRGYVFKKILEVGQDISVSVLTDLIKDSKHI